MAQAFLHGNGGTNPLNFKVVGSTTEPANPKENTIWAKTDIAIPEYTFSELNPPAYEAKIGTVSIYYTSSEESGGDATISFAKKTKIWGELGGLYQNQDGTASGWKRMNAYIYKSGSWVQFSYERLYLYNNGDECTDVTGGWKGRAWKAFNDSAVSTAPTIARNSNSMTISLSATKTGVVEVANDIDLTGWNTLVAEYSDCVSPSGERIVLEVLPRAATYWGNDNAMANTWLGEANTKGRADISQITGKYDVAICLGTWTPGNTQTVTIKEIYLE